MRIKLLLVASAMCLALPVVSTSRADQVEMQNGDRYNGKVLSMSADTVVLQSEVLGKINVPRKNVVSLLIGTNITEPKVTAALPRISSAATRSVAAPTTALANTNVDLSAALRNLGANTNFIQQIREQLLSGASPEASSKYDELLSGLASGKLNLNDIRAQAKSSADQLRAMKRDLGPEAGDSLDVYLDILDSFLKETASEPASTSAVPQQKILIR